MSESHGQKTRPQGKARKARWSFATGQDCFTDRCLQANLRLRLPEILLLAKMSQQHEPHKALKRLPDDTSPPDAASKRAKCHVADNNVPQETGVIKAQQQRGICQHGRQRSKCKECGGGSICQHGRRRTTCKECGGASICQHGRIRSRCKECRGQVSASTGGSALDARSVVE